jgi:uncharacterized repeat protein (TIGR03803 family)
MKTSIGNMFLAPGLIALALLAGLNQVPAQTFTTLHNFTNGIDGANPHAGLNLSGNTLYGTAIFGGTNNSGTVFAVNTDGTGFTNLYNFTGGSDGGNPQAGLILSGNTLYGTAVFGGTNDSGTVFAVNTNGTGFTNLYNFTGGSDGANPYAALILSGSTLYGTAEHGGTNGRGSVFAVNTNGTGFTNLHSFTAQSGNNNTNSDGAIPQSGLILSDNTLYGTAYDGGTNGWGTVFAVNTNGIGFTNLYNFTDGSDGANPQATLILSGNTLYGTARHGGSEDNGTVFAINISGTHFTNLYDFTGSSDEGAPYAGLILSGDTLYGTAAGDGNSASSGTVFAVNTNGTRFTNLYSFTALAPITNTNSDGNTPQAGLILSGVVFYGTASHGGSASDGTVFSLSLPQPLKLTIILSGTNVVLTWPTNATGFTLQSTANLSPAGWSTNLPAPVVINGQYTVRNPISGTQQFYRLSQ